MNIAIIGATGVVGKKFLELLTEYDFPFTNLFVFASERSRGKVVYCKDQPFIIETLSPKVFEIHKIDIALFSAGGSISEEYAPIAAEKGVVVIDNSSAWRMKEYIKLIVPEVNGNLLDGSEKIIANPNCSTIQSVVAIKPVDTLFKIKSIQYTTYQAVSGSGSSGIRDLERGLKGELPENYPHPIAFNVLPQIDMFLDSGFTKEEIKMVEETKKILGNENLQISATCVRVPVWNGHSVSMVIECEDEVDIAKLQSTLKKSPGVVLYDDPKSGKYPMPTLAEGTDKTFVGRLRIDLNNPRVVHMFCSADNIRKGAAANTIQIAQYLMEHKLI